MAASPRGLASHDLALLVRLASVGDGAPGEAVERLRADPGEVDRLLACDRVAEAVLRPPAPAADGDEAEPLLGVSPTLLFAVAVQRTADELPRARHVNEWAGPRVRLPVLGSADLVEMLRERSRRLFLVDLLASFTRVASGSVWRRTDRGWRRQRYSELDLLSLAATVDAVPEARRPAVHRRLGDLCLFLTGVFPDHTAGRSFRPIDLQRLGRAAGVGGGGNGLAEALELRGGVGLLEHLGARWYRLAAQADPSVAGPGLLVAMGERFVCARRVLNLLTDRYIFPLRQQLFPGA